MAKIEFWFTEHGQIDKDQSVRPAGSQTAGDSMPQDSICGDGPGVGLVLMHVVGEDSIWHTMEVLCAYGMWSRIWKESKFGAAVQPAKHHRSDRWHLTGQTGGGAVVRPATASTGRGDFGTFGPSDLHRSDRRHKRGQTGGSTSVRPISSI
uniref:Uncharacterized protein n=1 Tax=Oryza sativa subsp. japonica TaxID=39947 RepID=Q75HF4_ORYSJ|nr:hypothetical protein [Oryza sativa Japonica Group]